MTDFFDGIIDELDETDLEHVRKVCRRCFMEVSVSGDCECTS